MLPRVFRPKQQFQILDSIIEPISILVVNVMVLWDRSVVQHPNLSMGRYRLPIEGGRLVPDGHQSVAFILGD